MSKASTFVWQDEKAPLFDAFMVVSTNVQPIRAGDLCRVVHKAVVRKSAAVSSERIGQLEPGDTVTVIKTIRAKERQTRLQFDGGWVSHRSKKGDWLVVKDDRDGIRSVDYHVSYPAVEGDDPAPPTLDHFCLPTLADAAEASAPMQYTFVRTLDGGERQYGFCNRVRREDKRVLPNGESAPDTVEVFCILSRYQWFSFFFPVLGSLLYRRIQTLDQPDSMPQVRSIMDAVYQASLRRFPLPGAELQFSLPAVTDAAGKLSHPPPLVRPDDEHDPTVVVDYAELFRCIGAPGVLTLFKAMMSEQRVIMVSNDTNRLSTCMHGCLALLYPFRWQQIYVPLLPKMFLDYVTAPMPFMLGVHTSLFEQVLRLPTEADMIFAKLDAEEVLLCGAVPDALAKFPSSHFAALEKKVRRLFKDHLTAKPTITAAEFNRGISETFVEFMVSIFGKYRDFVGEEDYEFDIDGFTAAADRTEATRVFLQQFRNSQMFEAWGRERAALFARGKRGAAGDGGFSLAHYDKFEELVEVEGEFVGMNWMEKAIAKREKQAVADKQQSQKQKQERAAADARVGELGGDGSQGLVCREAVFEMVGPLGVSWVSRSSDDACVVKAIKPEGQAAQVDGMCAGLVLRAINGQPTKGMSYKTQVKQIRVKPRPLTLSFELPTMHLAAEAAVDNKRLVRALSDPGNTPVRGGKKSVPPSALESLTEATSADENGTFDLGASVVDDGPLTVVSLSIGPRSVGEELGLGLTPDGTVHGVRQDSRAELAGFRPLKGQRIAAVNSQPVTCRDDVLQILTDLNGSVEAVRIDVRSQTPR